MTTVLVVTVYFAVVGFAVWKFDLLSKLNNKRPASFEPTDFSDDAHFDPPEQFCTTPVTRVGDFDRHHIALGYHTEPGRKSAKRGPMVYSRGDTPVGIVTGATGSGKSKTILITALLLHGLNAAFQLIRNRAGNLGAPALIIAPKSELVEMSLEARKRQGQVAVWVLGDQELVPEQLRPHLSKWTPLSMCRSWKGALLMAQGLVDGALTAEGDNAIWSAAAKKTMAAVLWYTANHRPGTTLYELYEAVFGEGMPDRPEDAALIAALKELEDEDDEKMPSPLRRILFEIEQWMDVPAGTSPSPELLRRAEEARFARLALLDVASPLAPRDTVGSVLFTLATALSATLIPGVADTAWDDQDAIDIRKLLIDTSGTVALIATGSEMEHARPLTTAFLTAVRVEVERKSFFAPDKRIPAQLLTVIDELPVVIGGGAAFSNLLATVREFGMQMLYATQEVASMDHLWGEPLRARTINNTVDRLWFPFGADVTSNELAEQLGGEHREWLISRSESEEASKSFDNSASVGASSRSKGGSKSKSWSQQWRALVPKGMVARMRMGEALLQSQGRVAQITTVLATADPVLRSLIETGLPPAGFSAPRSAQEGGLAARVAESDSGGAS